jgi:hypothetical protein
VDGEPGTVIHGIRFDLQETLLTENDVRVPGDHPRLHLRHIRGEGVGHEAGPIHHGDALGLDPHRHHRQAPLLPGLGPAVHGSIRRGEGGRGLSARSHPGHGERHPTVPGGEAVQAQGRPDHHHRVPGRRQGNGSQRTLVDEVNTRIQELHRRQDRPVHTAVVGRRQGGKGSGDRFEHPGPLLGRIPEGQIPRSTLLVQGHPPHGGGPLCDPTINLLGVGVAHRLLLADPGGFQGHHHLTKRRGRPRRHGNRCHARRHAALGTVPGQRCGPLRNGGGQGVVLARRPGPERHRVGGDEATVGGMHPLALGGDDRIDHRLEGHAGRLEFGLCRLVERRHPARGRRGVVRGVLQAGDADAGPKSIGALREAVRDELPGQRQVKHGALNLLRGMAGSPHQHRLLRYGIPAQPAAIRLLHRLLHDDLDETLAVGVACFPSLCPQRPFTVLGRCQDGIEPGGGGRCMGGQGRGGRA